MQRLWPLQSIRYDGSMFSNSNFNWYMQHALTSMGTKANRIFIFLVFRIYFVVQPSVHVGGDRPIIIICVPNTPALLLFTSVKLQTQRYSSQQFHWNAINQCFNGYISHIQCENCERTKKHIMHHHQKRAQQQRVTDEHPKTQRMMPMTIA